jgi:hypothetical protein
MTPLPNKTAHLYLPRPMISENVFCRAKPDYRTRSGISRYRILENIMIRKLIFTTTLLLLLATGCAVHSGESAAEARLFSEPLPNEVAVHDHDDHSHEHVDESAATAVIQVVLLPSELAVGQNRMAVGLLDANDQMISVADVHFHYFDLADPAAPQLEREADAQQVQSPDGLTTIFTHERAFERAGEWGLEVQAQLAEGQTAVQRIKFNVAAKSTSLLPGEKAPYVPTPTLADVDGDFSRITSAWEPNPALYQLSLDEALGNGKPTVLLLATPAFCQTRFCGPAYETISALADQVGDAVNVLHVEVYAGLPDPSRTDWQLAPVMDAFGLATEPWVYVMGAEGTIVYRAEGVFTLDEITTHWQ